MNAAIYLPHLLPDMAYWLNTCGQWCEQRRHPVVTVAHTWDAAVQQVMDGRAELLVAGQRDHLPIDRSPRLEIITETAPGVTINQQRPRWRGRSGLFVTA